MISEINDAITQCLAAIKEVRRAFGPPGDYGYDHPEGKALKALYAANNRLSRASKADKRIHKIVAQEVTKELEGS